MKKTLKNFALRGFIAGGFGPLTVAVVYLVLSKTLDGFTLGGTEVFIAVVSTYVLAFLQACANVFYEIESWPIVKSMFFHFITLYAAYISCYLINSWIPFDIKIVAVFTGIFIVGYALIWLVILASIKSTEKRLNQRLK